MKKSIMVFVLIFVMIMGMNAQHCHVTRSDYEKVNISFSAADVNSIVEKTAQGNFSKIIMTDYFPSAEVGKPQLPVMVKLLQIPICDSVTATIVNADYIEVNAADLGVQNSIYPAQPSYPKSYRGEKTFTIDQTVYSQNEFYAQPLVRVEKVGVMRDVAIANIYFSPMAYNPVTKKIRLYRNVEVEVSYVNANLPATYELQTRYGSPMFQKLSEVVVNPMPRSRNEFNQSPIKYLIVAHSMFKEDQSLLDFVNWKKRMGYQVEVAYTDDPNVGTTNTSIKNFIKSKYTNATASNPAPTFLLLIGDHQQIPATSSTEQNSHVTDLYFATWTTGDNLPDCYYGRFSATNINELIPQIEKTLMYEQYTMPDPSYLGTAVLIAGTDSYWSSTHADGQINYVYSNYVNTTSTNHNYNTVYKHNYNCSSQAATIRNEIGAGCGWANYTAHGDVSEWYDPQFRAAQVSSMNNESKYGVMIGNCCLTGKFNETCFGETLLRTAKKGAMAYIGASEVSYWNEDVYWAVGNRSNVSANMTYNAIHLGAYDCLFHTHGEDYTNWSTCLGSFVQSGNLSVQSSSSNLKKYYWEIYHIFGDPSIKPYLGMPSTMPVSSNDVLMLGENTYSVTAVPYAYVALTQNGNLIGAAFADANGNATLTFEALSIPGEYELAVGAQNYVQYFKTVNAIAPTGPYVVATDLILAENEYPISGTQVHYSLNLQNMGVAAANNVSATMVSLTPGFTVSQNFANVGSVSVNANEFVSNAFTVNIPQNAIDGEQAQFKVTVRWQSDSSYKVVTIKALAPKVTHTSQIQSVSGATAFMPGDDVTASFTIKNEGHAAASSILTDLTCNYSGVVVNTPSQMVTFLGADEVTTHSFDLQISSSVPTVSIVPIYFHMIENGVDQIDTLYLTVGMAMETFESGDFSEFNWTHNNNAWTITNTAPYAGTYCARSNQNLSNSSKSQLSITINSTSGGDFSYFRKVSSEQSYDFFKLYVDGTAVDEASGSVGWTQKTIPVTAGTHTFKFSYEKDYSQIFGSDCAWIDNIVFPGFGTKITEDVEDHVGVEEHMLADTRLSVYPNPTTGSVVINNTQSAIDNVQIYDIYGKMVMDLKVGDFSTNINVSALANGMYLLKVTDENKMVKTTKIIKR